MIPYDLLSVEDLVQAKKTQRDKDWPIIGALVEGHYAARHTEANPERIAFWLRESRTAERLMDSVRLYPAAAASLSNQRPLLAIVATGDRSALAAALESEVRSEMDKDIAYWEPLKREMEQMRRDERTREA